MTVKTNDKTELYVGEWVDITPYVYERDAVSIKRGTSANSSSPEPSRLTLTLNNRDGRFSSRNPMSPYYGLLGRNTPIRVSVPSADGVSRLRLPGVTGSYVSCPDSPSLDITGAIDIRVDAETDTWLGSGDLLGKYDPAGDNRSFYFGAPSGWLTFTWSPDGTRASRRVAVADELLPVSRGRLAVRVTYDPATEWVTFYTADTIDGPWTQLGFQWWAASGPGIYSGSAPLQIGTATSFNNPFDGQINAVEIRDGINGTVVANPIFNELEAGRDDFSDAQGNVWSFHGMAEVSDRDYRFYGEVSEWPQYWDISGKDRTVKLQAFGIRRRLTLNAPPLRSAMYREYMNPKRTSIKQYWPMEDGQGATSIASGRANGSPMGITGTPQLASDDSWNASSALPVMGTGTFTGRVPVDSVTNAVSARMFVWVKEPVAAQTSLLKFNMHGGTLKRWELFLTPNGSIRTVGTAGSNTEDINIVDFTWGMNYNSLGFTMLAVELQQVTDNTFRWMTMVIDFRANSRTFDVITTRYAYSTVPVNGRVGNVEVATVGAGRGLTNVVVGHLAIGDAADAFDSALDWSNPDWRDLSTTVGAMTAHNGESPLNRMWRLCKEEDVPLITTRTEGFQTEDVLFRMGDQREHTLVELLDEAALSDSGMLHEPRDWCSFLYRDRESLVNQEPKVTLDYSAGHIAGDLAPVDDDTSTFNDVTVKREDGSSLHVEQLEGPLSIFPPPDGVGRYTHEVTVSFENDSMLADHAYWTLHMGTVDEIRYPDLTVDLHSPYLSDELRHKLLSVDIGDRIDITGFASVIGLPPEDVPQIVVGYTEELSIMKHSITFNLAPASPFIVGVVDESEYGLVGDGDSTLTVPVDAVDTELTVDPGSAGWTEDPTDFPFDILIGGERCTVQDVVTDGSEQVLTVVRSVNGIVKAHDAGTSIEVAHTATTAY